MTERDMEMVHQAEIDDLNRGGNLTEPELNSTGPLQTSASLAAFEEYMHIVERRAELVERLRAFAIAHTTPNMWESIQGRPYLNAAGCHRVAKVCIVRMEDPTSEKRWHTDENNVRFYSYWYKARFVIPNLGDSTYEIGTCSQHDDLFGTHKVPKLDTDGNPVKDKDGRVVLEKAFKPPSEVDEGTIEKAAMTNCKVRGVRAITALCGVTWDELALITKGAITPDRVRQVEFADREAGGSARKVSEAQVRKLAYELRKNGVQEKALLDRYKLEALADMGSGTMSQALQWIEQQGHTSAAAGGTDSGAAIAAPAAQYLRKGMQTLKVTDADFQAQFDCLPEQLPKTRYMDAKGWLDAKADN